MDSRLYDWLNWAIQAISSAWKYIFGKMQNDWDDPAEFEEEADDDAHGADGRRNSTLVNHESNNVPTNSQGTEQVVKIESNTGIVVIGHHSRISQAQTIAKAATELEENEQTPSLARSQPNDVNRERLSVKPYTPVNSRETIHKELRRRKRRSGEVVTARSKVPAVRRRINEVEIELTQLRENGCWEDHERLLKKLLEEYKRDEHNSDMIPLLMYEKAAAQYGKNEIDMGLKTVNELATEIKIRKTSDFGHLNDNLKMIACKCLLLTSKLYCVKKNGLGKSQKSLELARNLLSQCNDIELQAQFYLANAHHQLYVNKSNTSICSNLNRPNLVISYTNNAEAESIKLKDKKRWQEMKRQILLLRCEAIIQSYLHGGEKELEDLLNESLAELEHELWDGLSRRKKVQFYMLKSIYFLNCGNASHAFDCAKQALQIAEECQFSKEKAFLCDHIRKLKIFPNGGSSDAVVKKLREIETTTDGHAESGAAEISDVALFSNDDSEWDDLGQGGHFLPQIEDDETDMLNTPYDVHYRTYTVDKNL